MGLRVLAGQGALRSSLAEFERELIRERTVAGLEEPKAALVQTVGAGGHRLTRKLLDSIHRDSLAGAPGPGRLTGDQPGDSRGSRTRLVRLSSNPAGLLGPFLAAYWPAPGEPGEAAGKMPSISAPRSRFPTRCRKNPMVSPATPSPARNCWFGSSATP